MKKTNLNGQVLSEMEMKEVKGGYSTGYTPQEILAIQPEKCVCCGFEFKGSYKFKEGKHYCQACGCQIQVEDEE